MDQYEDQREGLIVGFRFILWENMFSIIFLFMALYHAHKKWNKKAEKHARFEDIELADVGGTTGGKADREIEPEGDEYTKDEVIKEIYRKRMLSHGSFH